MSTPSNFLDFPWRWQLLAGRPVLVAENGMVILCGPFSARLQTRDFETRALRDLDPCDDIAKIIAAAPDVRRHAQSLIHGINIGLFRIEADGDEKIADEVLRQLREALARSGAV